MSEKVRGLKSTTMLKVSGENSETKTDAKLRGNENLGQDVIRPESVQSGGNSGFVTIVFAN